MRLGIDRGDMEASLRRLAAAGLVTLLVLIAVLFRALRRFVDRGLMRPMQQLALAANPLKAGQCLDPDSLPEELARLAETFRRLCGEIHAHLSEREHADF